MKREPGGLAAALICVAAIGSISCSSSSSSPSPAAPGAAAGPSDTPPEAKPAPSERTMATLAAELAAIAERTAEKDRPFRALQEDGADDGELERAASQHAGYCRETLTWLGGLKGTYREVLKRELLADEVTDATDRLERFFVLCSWALPDQEVPTHEDYVDELQSAWLDLNQPAITEACRALEQAVPANTTCGAQARALEKFLPTPAADMLYGMLDGKPCGVMSYDLPLGRCRISTDVYNAWCKNLRTDDPKRVAPAIQKRCGMVKVPPVNRLSRNECILLGRRLKEKLLEEAARRYPDATVIERKQLVDRMPSWDVRACLEQLEVKHFICIDLAQSANWLANCTGTFRKIGAAKINVGWPASL